MITQTFLWDSSKKTKSQGLVFIFFKKVAIIMDFLREMREMVLAVCTIKIHFYSILVSGEIISMMGEEWNVI